MFEYRFASLVALLTFGLIVYGGVVHNTESGLACPDWPLCYGELFPDKGSGTRIEMGHRMVAAGVGLLTIALSLVVSVRKRFSIPFRRLTFLAVILVSLQGTLGALTVLFRLPSLVSTAHLALSIVFLSVLMVLAGAARFSIGDRPVAHLQEQVSPLAGTLKVLILFLCVQILLGAFVRHTGSGAAAGIGPEASILGVDPDTGKTTLWPIQIPGKLNMVHRYLAMAITLFTLRVGMKMYRIGGEVRDSRLKGFALSSITLVILQVAIGMLSLRSFLSVGLVTAHLAVGTLLYMDLFSTYLYVRFLISPYDYRRKVPVASRHQAAIDTEMATGRTRRVTG